MATDVVLDQGSDGSWVNVEARVLNVTGSDVIIDAADRRRDSTGFRRALVHDGNDGLTVNFGGDYPGGVSITDAHVQLHVEGQRGPVRLPKDGVLGQLLVTKNRGEIQANLDGDVTLWLCLGRNALRIAGDLGATWVPITTGAPVTGDA